jgi:WD40 repeat protein
MNLAQQALAANDRGRAVMLLERQKPEHGQEDLRGWEWRYLWSQIRPNEHEVFFRGSNRLSGLEFSNDGRFLMWFTYIEGAFTEMTVTDVQTRETVMSRTDCRRAAFAQRSPWLIFSQQKEDETDDIVFWDLDAWREIRRLPLLGADVSWLGFTPDDRLLISLSYRVTNLPAQSPYELTVWEVSTGEIQWRQVIKTPIAIKLRRAAISPDGQLIALSIHNFGFRVLGISDGSERFLRGTNDTRVRALTFSPDGTFLLSASGPGSMPIQVWNVATGECVRTLEGHRSYVSDIQFTSDGKHLISSSSDQTICLWDWREGRPVAILRGHLDEVDGLSVSPDGRTFASRCRDGSIFLWPLYPSTRPPAYRTLMVDVPNLRRRPPVFTSDSKSIIAVDPNGQLAQWDVATLRQTRLWRTPDRNGKRVDALVPDGTQAAILDANGCVSLLDLTTGTERINVLRNAPPVRTCYFSASGRYLVTHTADWGREQYESRFWDLISMQMTGMVEVVEGGVTFHNTLRSPSWGFHREDAWVIGQNGNVKIRSMLQPEAPPLTLLCRTRDAYVLAFDVSPDGRLGAAAYAEGYLRIWDMETTEPLQTMRVFLRSPHSVAFSPDGRRLAAGSHDREAIKLWETATWQEVLTLAGEGTRFNMVAFSPDGQTLMAGNSQEQLHIWTAPSLEDIKKADAPSPQIP